MNIDLLVFNGYGQFIWPAFMFTFSICFLLYLKVKKDFQKQEKIFLNEFKNCKLQKLKSKREKKIPKKLYLESHFN